MNLKDQTTMLKQYCLAVKQNYFKMGGILKNIRDKQLFKESYDNFTEYLESSDFEFTRQYAYKLIYLFEEYGPVNPGLHLTKLLQITHVSDKEQREVIIQKALNENLTRNEVKQEVQKINTERLYSSIERSSQREDSDLDTQIDSKLDKAKRIGNKIIDDLEAMKTPLNQMKTRIENWIQDFSEYSNELDTLKSVILKKNMELKEIIFPNKNEVSKSG